jgi:predicted RNA-binding Zn-ribbon protein involved in translation (DUF1610 family)
MSIWSWGTVCEELTTVLENINKLLQRHVDGEKIKSEDSATIRPDHKCPACGKIMVRHDKQLYSPMEDSWFWWCKCGHEEQPSHETLLEAGARLKRETADLWERINKEEP